LEVKIILNKSNNNKMQVQSQKLIESSESSIKNLWSSTNAQAILDSLVDPLFILDENGVIIEVNSYAEELFEYSRDELIGHINISQLIPILNLDKEETLSKYIEKSVITTGVRKSLRDQKNDLEIDVSLSCYYNKDVISTSSTNITGIYLVSVRDVTRQLTEMEWSKSRYQTEFKEIKCIGKGGFGSVYLAKNKLDEQIYAIKKIPLQCHPQDYIECMNLIDTKDKLNEEYDSGCSSGCNELNSEGKENDYYKSDDKKIVENMKSTLTLDDLRVIREVKNFAKFRSHPNVVRYYASWVEPVLLNENLEEISDSKINSEQRSQEIFDSPPVEPLHPNTTVDMRNNPNTQNEHYSIYDSINLSPMDNSPNSFQQDQIELINTNFISTNQNNDYRNTNQNRIQNQNYNFNTKTKTHLETEEEDFDIFGNGPTDLKMMTSIPQNFVNSNKSNNINNTGNNNSPIINNQNYSSITPSSNVTVNSKKKEILDFMPSSFESYPSSFDSKQTPQLSSSLNNLKTSISFNIPNNNPLFNTNSNPKIHLCNNNNIESQYKKNVRNFYKNCDNLSQYNFNDNVDGQGSYSTVHESHSLNNISESSTRGIQTSSIYTNDSICDTSRSDNTSTISDDDDESSLTLLELPIINSSNEELNVLSSSQTNLNNYSENEISNTDDSIIIQNNNNQQYEGKEEIVRTRFSDENDIFLTYPEENSKQNKNNLKNPSGNSQCNDEQSQINNSSSCINIPNKGGNKCHQSDNETCNSYNSTYSNNSIKTMLLENQYSMDDKKEEMMKIQDKNHEESAPIHANNVITNTIFEEENDSNSNAIYPNGVKNNDNTNTQDCFDDEFSTGSSVSTIVDDCDLAKSTIYQIPAKTMLYIQMEYSSPNNLRKWIRERNAKIWKHAPFLNNNQENSHLKHSKHWFLDYINRKKNLTLLQQITMGLEHIHKSGFIHRDIKPANIFISENRVMIGDFGLTKRYIKDNTDYDINDLVITDDSGKDHADHLEMLMKEELAKDNNNNNYSMKTIKGGEEHDLTLGVGTLLYASPEQLSRKPYSFATDIYSLSVIMLELFFPFCTSFDRMMHLVNLRKGEIPDCLKKRWPEECELLLSMANVDPQLRPSATEVLETINRLLVRQPSKFSNIKNLYLPKSYDLFNPVFHGLRTSNDSDSQIFEESSMTLSSLSAEEMPMIENDSSIIKSPEECLVNPRNLNINWSQGISYIDEINNENEIEK
jgi:PAS domain S-box-containing protein